MVSVGFYNHGFAYTVDKKTIETVDKLFTELKSLLGEIPNVTVIEK
jgi:hypothetical protein